MLAQHQVALGKADVLRMHDLVRRALFEPAVLVNARLVSERIAAHNRLVTLHLQAGDRRYEPAGGNQAGRGDRRFAAEIVEPRAQRHHDFLQRTIAGPLANAVDRALDLAGTVFYRRQAIGHSQAQVVVAMDADHGLVDVGYAVAQHGDDAAHQGWSRIADGIRNIDRRRPRRDRRLDYLAEKIVLRARRILRREFHVAAIGHRPPDTRHRPLDDFLASHFQFELAVNGARGEEHVDARRFRRFQRLPGAVDVRVVAAGQTAHRGAPQGCRDFSDRLEVSHRSDRKAGFQHVYAQLLQRLSHLHLFAEIHTRAG